MNNWGIQKMENAPVCNLANVFDEAELPKHTLKVQECDATMSLHIDSGGYQKMKDEKKA